MSACPANTFSDPYTENVVAVGSNIVDYYFNRCNACPLPAALFYNRVTDLCVATCASKIFFESNN